jgi:hypothetical protein
VGSACVEGCSYEIPELPNQGSTHALPIDGFLFQLPSEAEPDIGQSWEGTA